MFSDGEESWADEVMSSTISPRASRHAALANLAYFEDEELEFQLDEDEEKADEEQEHEQGAAPMEDHEEGEMEEEEETEGEETEMEETEMEESGTEAESQPSQPHDCSSQSSATSSFVLASFATDPSEPWRTLGSLMQGDMSPGVLRRYRHMVSSQSAPDELLALPVLATLGTGFYRPGMSDDALLQLSWAMINITAIGSGRSAALVQAGVLFILFSVTEDTRTFGPQVRLNVLWALGNIAGESAELRDQVLASDSVLKALTLSFGAHCLPRRAGTPPSPEAMPQGLNIENNNTTPPGSLETVTWVVQNLCASRDGCCASIQRVVQLLPHLRSCLLAAGRVISNEALLNVLWALSFLCNSEDAHIQAVIDASIVPLLAELAAGSIDGGQGCSEALFPAIHALAGIISGTDVQAQAVVETGFVPCFVRIARYHSDRCVRKEACWALANLAAGSPAQIDLFLRLEVHRTLITVLEHDPYDRARQEAARGLTNLMRAQLFVTLEAGDGEIVMSAEDREVERAMASQAYIDRRLPLVASEITLAFVRCLARDQDWT